MITTDPGNIEVTFNTELNDLNRRQLNSISVQDNRNPNPDIKTIYFNYLREKTIDNDPSIYDRIYLDYIQEEYENCEVNPPFRFSYYSSGLPKSGSPKQDLWGYYADNGQADLFPEVHIHYTSAEHEKFRLIKDGTHSNYTNLSGANRSPATTASRGALSTITTPHGGTTEIFWELNQYYDDFSSKTWDGGGVRVHKTVTSDGIDSSNDIITEYEYDQSNGETSGRLINRPQYAIPLPFYKEGSTIKTKADLVLSKGNDHYRYLIARSDKDLSGGSSVVYKEFTIKQTGAGKTVQYYEFPALYGDAATGLWEPTSIYLARNQESSTCAEYGLLSTGTFIYPFSPNTNYSFARGNLDKLEQFNETGTKVRTVEYTYAFDYPGTATTPVEVKALNYNYFDSYYTGTSTDEDPTFSLGYYKILTEVDNFLTSETETLELEGITKTTSYEYNDNLDISRIVTTDSEGTEHASKIRYVYDYQIPTSGGNTQTTMLRDLSDNFQRAIPVEQISTRKVSGGSEEVIGATITLFDDFNGNTLPSKILGLDIGTPLSDYSESTITSNNFTYDSRLEAGSEVLEYSSTGIPVGNENRNRRRSGVHLGYGGTLPILEIAGAAADEVIFSDFETTTDHDFDATNCISSTDARTGAASMQNGLSATLAGEIVNRERDSYIFSFWINSTAASTWTLTLKKSDNSVFSTVAINTTSTQGNWEYVEEIIDVSTYPSTENIMKVEVSLSAQQFKFDDVAFYPEESSIASTTYAPSVGVTSVTGTNGRTTFYQYNARGNLEYVIDDKGDVLSKTEYFYGDEEKYLWTFFDYDGPVYKDDQVTFTASDPCITGLTYAWTIDHLVVPEQNVLNNQTGSITQAYTFTELGSYKVTLTVSHPDYGSATYFRIINVLYPEIVATICAVGPVSIDLCGVDSNINGSCSGTPEPNQTNFEIQSVTGGISGQTLIHTWQVEENSSGFWYDLGSGGTGGTLNHCDRSSYKIRLKTTIDTTNCDPHCNYQEYYSNEISVNIYYSTPSCTENNDYCQML